MLVQGLYVRLQEEGEEDKEDDSFDGWIPAFAVLRGGEKKREWGLIIIHLGFVFQTSCDTSRLLGAKGWIEREMTSRAKNGSRIKENTTLRWAPHVQYKQGKRMQLRMTDFLITCSLMSCYWSSFYFGIFKHLTLWFLALLEVLILLLFLPFFNSLAFLLTNDFMFLSPSCQAGGFSYHPFLSLSFFFSFFTSFFLSFFPSSRLSFLLSYFSFFLPFLRAFFISFLLSFLFSFFQPILRSFFISFLLSFLPSFFLSFLSSFLLSFCSPIYLTPLWWHVSAVFWIIDSFFNF